ncbi:MAG: tetratricopeptide repeat protein [Sedimentisphaerales bacterium]
MTKNPDKNWSLLICLTLTLVTLAVYFQVRGFPFVNYDDPVYVSQNSNIHAGISFNAIRWAFTTGYAKNWHPLTWLSHMLDWQFYGSNPAGHHLTNLIFHIANTLLLFLVLKQMSQALWPSAFVAALFALHPLHVESVAWVSERKDVLSTFFWLLTMWAYVRYVRRPKAVNYLLIVVFLALGLMAKPMLVTLPFVLLLLDYWPLNRFASKRSLLDMFIEKVPLFAIVAASSIITFIVQKKGGAVNMDEYNFPIRLANAFISWQSYIVKMIWPVHLAVFYPHPGQDISILYAVISAVLLLVVTILILRFAGSHKYLFTGWFWYIGTLVPVIGLLQVGDQTMADRYSYITLTGLFIIAAWGVPELLAKWRYKKMMLISSAVLIIFIMSVYTFFQLGYWQSNLTLFRHALDVTKKNYMAHFCLAAPLRDANRLDEAIYHCSRATQLKPEFLQAHIEMSYLLRLAGRMDEAAEECWKCLEIKPDEPNALNGIGVVFGMKGKPDLAVKYLSLALKFNPNFVEAHNNLGYALTLQGKYDQAADHFIEALRLDPRSAIAHYHLGGILVQKGRLDEAISHFKQALLINSDFTDAKNSLNAALAEKQKSPN